MTSLAVDRPSTHEEAVQELRDLRARPEAEREAVLARLIREAPGQIREAAIRIAAEVLSDETLIRFARIEDDDILRNAALEALKVRGSAAFDIGVSLLNDADDGIVIQAVLLLDHVRDPRALPALRPLLGHANPNVEQSVAVAIGHLGGESDVDTLAELLEREMWLQLAAVQALGDLRCDSAVRPLLRVIHDPFLSRAALESLARIGTPNAYGVLSRKWLEDGDDSLNTLQLMAHVAESMAGEPHHHDELVEALRKALYHPSPAVRHAAARTALAAGVKALDRIALDILSVVSDSRGDLPACLKRRGDLVEQLLEHRGVGRAWAMHLLPLFPESVKTEDLAAALLDCVSYDHLDAAVAALTAVTGPELGEVLIMYFGALPPDARAGWGPVLEVHQGAIRKLLETWPDDGESTLVHVLSAAVADPTKAVEAILALPRAPQLEALSLAANRPEVMTQLPWSRWLAEDPAEYGPHAVRVAKEANLEAHLPELRKLLAIRPHRDLVKIVSALRDEESVALLETFLLEGEPGLEPYVLAGLGSIGGERARGILRRYVDKESSWRRFAYRALAECLLPTDMEVFRQAAADNDWHIRRVAAGVLGVSDAPEDRHAVACLAADPVAAVADYARSRMGTS